MNSCEPESDGEIEDEDETLDSISSNEEDFFQKMEKIQHEIKRTESRKAELELENSFGELNCIFFDMSN